MKFLMIFLAMALVSCRPASEVVDRTSKTETVTYQPGAKVKVIVSDTEDTTPLFTADVSLMCNDLTFYDPNGVLLQGTRDCRESLPDCREDGDINCRATANNPSVIKTELETKIIAGEKLAGVEGAAAAGEYTNCSAAGQIGCITTSAFKAMDASLSDSSTDLTASNFNATIASAGNFEFWDATGTRHMLSGDANLTAINIKDGVTLFGIAGSLTGAPANCASDGEGNCLVDGTNYRAAATAGAASKILSGQSVAGIAGNVTLPAQGTVLTGTNYGVGGTSSSGTLTLPSAVNVRTGTGNYGNPSSPVTPSYSPDFPDLANVRAGDTVNGANGTLNDCSSDGGVGCVVVGPSYAAASTTGAASKILAGQSIAGVSGNVTLPALGNVLTGTSYGVNGTSSSGTLTLPASNNVLTGSGTYGDPGSPITPSYSPDFPAAENVLSSDTVDNANGTLTLPSAGDVEFGISYGVSGNGSIGTFAVPTTVNVASGVNYGADGSEFSGSASIESHTDCTGAGQTGCIATATYATMDLSNKDVGGALDLNATDFSTRMKSASLFEYWDENGVRYTANGDADIIASNIKSSVDIFGASGSVTEAPTNCSVNGSQACVATGTFYAATACSADASNCFLPTYVASTQPLKAINFDAIDAGKSAIRSSLTLSGVSGTLTDCSSDGGVGCVVVGPNYAAAVTTGAASKILSGQSIAGIAGNVTLPAIGKVLTGTSYGVSGTGSSGTLTLPDASDVLTGSGTYGDPGSALTPSFSPDFPDAANVRSIDTVNGASGTLANCSTGGSADCVTTSTYPSMNLSTTSGTGLTSGNFSTAVASASTYQFWDSFGARHTVTGDPDLTAGNIKNSVVIHGVTGGYPSSTYRLPSASATADLDNATFNAKIKSATAFEYWTSNGTYQTGNGDGDIQDFNIKTGVNIFGTTGVYAGPPQTPTGLTATSASSTEINLSWNNMSMPGYLLITREDSAVSFTPVNGTSYSTGFQGSNEVIFVGAGTSYNHTGLTSGTTYHYALYSYDNGYNYSSAVTTSQLPESPVCGGAGDNCYDDTAAKTAGVAVTPLGKNLEYVFANGSSGFKVWKEVGSTRVLRANGLDEWAKALNLNGKGQSATDFTDANLGTASTKIKGRVCPPNVYISDSNKFSTGNCLYYSPGYSSQTLNAAGSSQSNASTIGLTSWNTYTGGTARWYVGNIYTCSSRGMRLATIFETTTTVTSDSYYPSSDGSPTFAQGNGVPTTSGYTYTATSWTGNTDCYQIWTGTYLGGYCYYNPYPVLCVLP